LTPPGYAGFGLSGTVFAAFTARKGTVRPAGTLYMVTMIAEAVFLPAHW
jgi:hypothetical protein